MERKKSKALTGGDRVSGKEDRTLIGEVIAVVLEQAVGLWREAVCDGVQKILENLLCNGGIAQTASSIQQLQGTEW